MMDDLGPGEHVDAEGSIVMDARARAAHALRLAVLAALAGGLDRGEVDRVVAEAHQLAGRLHAPEGGRSLAERCGVRHPSGATVVSLGSRARR
jgi:hypothetical protein